MLLERKSKMTCITKTASESCLFNKKILWKNNFMYKRLIKYIEIILLDAFRS